ncbi:acyl-CoA dehydrogenase family member 9, mitochondrial [Fopius arisanus]|uniref:Acyl-CoA dehydrogenase family member 9, mitochondrial n=1 Tax=Fopius arisanus TaxID=64838 RepID=A0A9R1TCS9_9HYME|nr:PREDICTED: acyl-CoA dehydrogenase family member 9, mitochondrial [Fopius arisanus]XP_011306694.1 PREDICTED: acyl-CoA dehydrogenase family member 9, mitochondrial [Fopius arisanus]
MLRQSLSLRFNLRQLSRVVIPTRSSSTELNPRLSLSQQELRLSEHKEKQEQREPFVKNFFLGKYDVEFAAIPVPQTTLRHGEFFEWLKPIEDYVATLDIGGIDASGEIPQEILDNFRDLGIFRAMVPDEYKGLGLNTSEFGKLVETVSAVPVLGTYLVKKRSAVQFIIENSSEEQKARFLPGIASGELSSTACISENDEGSPDSTIFTYARLSDCEGFYILNGKKTFVFDGKRSNLMLIVCEVAESGKSFRPEETSSAFLLETNTPGITISPPVDTVGLRGLENCDVTFTDVKIPLENLVGSVGDAGRNFPKIYGEGKQFLGCQAIGITKKFLQLVVHHIKSNKDFNALKFKNQVVQDVVGRACGAIYAMESIVYMTCGMIDNYENQDCDMEKCIVETFCSEECIQGILKGLQLVGITSQLKNQLFQQFFRDAVSLMSADGTVLSTSSFMALLGLQHSGDLTYEKVKIERNPWNNPTYVLKKVFGWEQTKDLYIADNLHPSLQPTADVLTHGIARFKDCVERLSIIHGRDIFEKSVTHKRLAEFASYLFVISATLARTNRSYCLGMRDAEKEVYLTQVYGYVLYERMKKLADQLEDNEWINGDVILQDISNGVFEKNGYFLTHPLARNFS